MRPVADQDWSENSPMSLDTWLIFCATETVLCLTPGLAVLLVLSLSLSRGRRAGFLASLGILCANAGYFALSASGIAAILIASWEIFFLIRWVGALYLIGLGLRMLFRKTVAPVEENAPPAFSAGWRSFVHALVTQAANPKTLLFFSALLPQFVDPESSVVPQVLILGQSSVLIEFAVLSLYVVTAQRVRDLGPGRRAEIGLRRVGGLLLIAAGAGLARLSRVEL